MNSSPLKLDLTSAQCLSLELQFDLRLPDDVRRELAILGSHESDHDDLVYFHEDYVYESRKLHSWGEVQLVEAGESDILVEYLVESELEDQTEIHHTDFTLTHLFDALAPVQQEVEAAFTMRFDLGSAHTARFTRLLGHQIGLNGSLSVEYKGAHMQVKSLAGELYDLWFDVRPDDTVEITLRFTLKERPAAELPGHGLTYGRKVLAKLLSS